MQVFGLDDDVFPDAQEKDVIGDVFLVFSDSDAGDQWWNWFELVHQVAESLNSLRSWGGGCSCHEEERKRGKQVECVEKVPLKSNVPKSSRATTK